MLDEEKADEAITIYQSRFPDLKMAASLKSKLKMTAEGIIYNTKTPQISYLRGFIHAPEKIRTPDTTVRSRMLYPAELLTHAAACLSLTAQELLYPLWR